MTGQHIIWTQCNADWCIHCLTSSYFFNLNGTYVTVIDHHPRLTGTESYYRASQCSGNSNYDLFSVSANALLTFIGCTLVDIRAQFYTFAGVYGSVAFIHTQILRMDFYFSFVWAYSSTSVATVLFDNSYVTGWHRDHPLLNINFEEYDLLYIYLNVNLIIRNTTFEENYELSGTFVTYFEFMYFYGLYLEITDSVFRYCIGAFNLNSYQSNAVILIRNVTIDSNFNYFYSNLFLYWTTSEQLVVSDLHFLNCLGTHSIMQVSGNYPALVLEEAEFTNNRLLAASYNAILYLASASTVVLLNCTFTNNGAYSDSYAPYFFYNHLLSLGLINPYPQIAQFFTQATSASCLHLIYTYKASNVTLSDVIISGDLENPCATVITLDTLQGTNWTVAVSLTSVRIAGGSEFGIAEPESGQYTNELTFLVTNSVFEDLGSALNIIKKIVIIQNSTFRNLVGTNTYTPIDISGSLYLLNCYFLNCSGLYTGAVFLHLDTISSANVLSIINCVFDGNTAVLEGASDVAFSSFIQYVPAFVEIRDCVFKNSKGVSQSFSLEFFDLNIESGIIANCTFSSAQEMLIGLILLEPSNGTFYLLDILVDSIFAPTSNLVAFETNFLFNVTLENLIVRNCSCRNCLLLSKADLIMKSCTFDSNTGIVLYHQTGKLEDYGSHFWNNTNYSSPCYRLNKSGISVFYGTSFINNAATQTGAIEIAGPSSVAIFEGCEFNNNSAKELTGVMQLTDSPLVAIVNCTFFRNFANSISVFLLEKVLTKVLIVNSLFIQNRGSGLLKAVYSSVMMQNVTFADMDFTGKDYQIMLVSNSKFTLQNSNITSLHGLQGQGGCFMSILMGSSANISGTIISELQCTQSIIIVMLSSSLTLIENTFYNVSSSRSSLINSSSKGSLIIKYTHFTNVSALQVVLFTQYTDINVVNSSFEMVKGAMILHTESCSSVNIQSTYFGNVTTQTDVGGVQSVGCTQVVIKDSNFTYIWATVTAGVQVSNGNVTVINCKFQHLTALIHGGIEIESGSLYLSQSDFFGNSAGMTSYSFGGAVYVNTPSNTSISINNNSFTRNSARAGGALYWNSTQSMSKLQGNNSYSGNTALYGNDTAYSMFKLRLGNSSIPVLASGQVYTGSILIEIVDQLGQVIVTDNSSKVLMTGSSLRGNLVATAVGGAFTLSAFVVTGVPGTSVNVIIIPNTPNCLNISISFTLRDCVIGEIEVSNGACVRCSEGTYSLNLKESTCSNCFTEAMCINGSDIYPNPGYWRPDELYEGLFKCPNSDACTNNQTSTTGICAEGYTGNMCQSCAEGYSHSGQDKCAGCPSQQANLIRLSFLGLGLFIFIVILVRTALKSATTKQNFYGVFLKILMNYLQITVLIANFSMNWPSVLQGMFEVHAILGSSGEQFISLDCSLSQAYFTKLVIIAVLPVVLLIANVGLWGFLHFILYIQHVGQKLICSVIVCLLYVHPIIVIKALSAFHCVTIKPGEQWLRDEMDIQCWDHSHSIYALRAALPALILWGFGIPSAALIMLIKNRKQLKNMSVKLTMGFLSNGYKDKTYFWEVIIVYRKVCIVVLYVFLSSEPPFLQALALCILMWIAGSIQSRYGAFQTAELNKLELRSIWVSFITIYTGIFFSTNAMPYEVELTLSALIICVNAYFLALWVFYFSRVFFTQLVQKHPQIRRLLPFLHIKESESSYERRLTLPPYRMHLYLIRLYRQIEERDSLISRNAE